MTALAYLIPITLLAGLSLWTWALMRTLRNEENYIWLFALLLIPPLAIPAYMINFLILDDEKNGLTAFLRRVKLRNRAREIEEELEDSSPIGLREELADIYYDLGQYRESLRHLSPALDRDPENLKLQYSAAKALLEVDEIERAAEHLEYIVEERPNYNVWQAMLLLAECYRHLERSDEMHRTYERLRSNSNRPEVIFRYARAMENSDKHEEAVERLRQLVEEFDQEPGLTERADRQWINRARQYLQSLTETP